MLRESFPIVQNCSSNVGKVSRCAKEPPNQITHGKNRRFRQSLINPGQNTDAELPHILPIFFSKKKKRWESYQKASNAKNTKQFFSIRHPAQINCKKLGKILSTWGASAALYYYTQWREGTGILRERELTQRYEVHCVTLSICYQVCR